MRFIDVDALRDYWHISEPCENCHWNNIDCSKPPYYSLLDICQAIDEIPTVDAIPVEWLESQIKLYTDDVSDIGKSAKNGTIKELVRKWQKEQGER